jgi:hypothetical protein
MGALHRDDGKEINRVALLGNSHGRCQAGEPATHNRYLDSIGCHEFYLTLVTG